MDYYEILQVTDQATQEEIKKSYQQLVLKHHPDKSTSHDKGLDTFLRIDEAYKILKDPLTRKEYDSRRFQESSRCQMIVHDTVAKRDFAFDETNEVHYHVCKCGGWYILDEENPDEKEYIICCDECSLVIKVVDNKSS